MIVLPTGLYAYGIDAKRHLVYLKFVLDGFEPLGMTELTLPKELERVREAARRAISPVAPAGTTTKADKNFLFTAKRTDAGRDLPPYYLVYFLLVDLLGFKDLGKFEKLAWSVPIDLDGKAYLIEHRKLGVGVFARDEDGEEKQAQRIVSLIGKGVKAASPFFKWMADNAVRESKLNIRNVGRPLFDRYVYFRDGFRDASREAKKSEEIQKAEWDQRAFDIQLYSLRERQRLDRSELVAKFKFPFTRRSDEANWLALAAIEAFFAWTEHILIHIGILRGKITTGEGVAKMVGSEWKDKFKNAFDLSDPTAKDFLDALLSLRRQLRNFMTHGAFGKEGEAFRFHSSIGAVPVALDYRAAQPKFSLTPELAFDDEDAIETIERFIAYLWSGSREPARLYIQESSLPLILPWATDGTYALAMSSSQNMREYILSVEEEFDRAANMDW